MKMRVIITAVVAGVFAASALAFVLSARANDERSRKNISDFLKTVAVEQKADECATSERQLMAFYAGERVAVPLAELKSKVADCH